ncbi:MAG TPA: nucleoside diphosphate kinase regulator [Phycisphaeraceae bacterium]
MQTRTVVVTSEDLNQLRELIRQYREARSEEHQYLMALERKLSQAEVVEPGQVPPDLVTMNSTLQVRVDGSRRNQNWTIVYPQDADMDENRISVLAPLGTALLGHRAGDTVEWDVPAGRRRYQIVKIVHQPEATGQLGR